MEKTMQMQFLEVRDRRQKEWFWLDNILLDEYAKVIGPNATLVYIALSRHADNELQNCWPSMETIADEIGIKSRNTVAKGIKTLVRYGMIEVHQSKKTDGTHNNNVYTLVARKHWKGAVVEEPIVPTKEERPAPVQEKILDELPSWLDRAAWTRWEEYRKEIRKKLTPSTIKMQLKQLEEHKADHVAMIDQSIQNGWTGLFPFKGKKGGARQDGVKATPGKYASVGQKV